MADTPVEVDVNTDNLDDFNLLFNGKAVPKQAVEEVEDVDPVEDADETEVADEQETEEVETPDGDEDTDDADEDVTDEVEVEEDILKPKPKRQTAKERIDELTAEKYAERRRATELEQRLVDLERQLREDKEDKEPKPAQVRIVDNDMPDPDAVDKDGNIVYPLGEFDPRYVADLTKHMVQKDLAAARETAQAEAAAAKQQEADRAIQTQWEGKLVEATKEIPDLRETIVNLESHFADIEPQYGTYLAQTIMGMDAGPEVLYYLANNPDEADKIVASGPTGATLALGRLEARIQAALAKRATPPARVTAAPKPASSTRGTGARHSVRADTDDLDAFEKQFFNYKK